MSASLLRSLLKLGKYLFGLFLLFRHTLWMHLLEIPLHWLASLIDFKLFALDLDRLFLACFYPYKFLLICHIAKTLKNNDKFYNIKT